MAAVVPGPACDAWPPEALAPGGAPAAPRRQVATALAERLAAVEQLLRGQSDRAEHLAVQLSSLHAETEQLAAELAAMASSRCEAGERREPAAGGSDLPYEGVTGKDLPGMPCSELQSTEDKDPDFPGVFCSELQSAEAAGDQKPREPLHNGSAAHAASDKVPQGGEVQGKAPPDGVWGAMKKSGSMRRIVPRLPPGAAIGRTTSNARVFAHSEDLIEQIREKLAEDARPDVTAHYHDTGCCQAVARSWAFETLSLVVICINAAWIAIEIDLNPEDNLLDAEPIFQVAAHLFCIFFIVELLVRIMAFKSKRDALKECWILFDMVLVVLIVIETWVKMLLFATGSMPLFQLNAFVVFRILRLLRVLRLARVLRELHELLIIVRAIAIAFRAISIVLALLFIAIYMGAIVFRVLAEHSTWGATYFPNIPKALETLLLKVTLSGTKGGPVIADGWDENFFFGFLLLVFSLVANVTIMGVLGGLLVQTVKTVAEVEKEESQVKSMRLSMDNLWEDLVKGQVDTASICERQLRQNLKRTHIVKALQGIGVDLEGLVNASGFVFEQHEGHLSKPQFKRMLMDQRGKNAAKVKDHVETRRFIDMMFKRNGRKTTKTDSITTQTDNVGPA